MLLLRGKIGDVKTITNLPGDLDITILGIKNDHVLLGVSNKKPPTYPAPAANRYEFNDIYLREVVAEFDVSLHQLKEKFPEMAVDLARYPEFFDLIFFKKQSD